MAFLRYAVPALAAAGSALAQQCSSSSTNTVVAPADASALSSCTTYSGSIAIATEAAGIFDFGNLRSISGDFKVQGASNVTAIQGSGLRSIGGEFNIDNLQNLNTLSFPQLTEVGSLSFTGLPNLNQLGFTQNIQSASSLNIQNTFLNSLSGINLQSVDTIYIANNRLLQQISFQVSNLSGTINVESNGDKLNCQFPNLITAKNITFRAVPQLSIPSLTNTTGSLGFYECTLSSISAPNLTTVGGTLAINTNMQLTNISIPNLETIIGGLQIQNNTILPAVEFQSLATVRGATDIFGNFTSVKLPALKDNRGAFNIQSSQDISSSCAVFNGIKGANNVIKGKYQCAGNQSKPGGQNSTPTSGTSSSSTAASSQLKIPSTAATGLLGVCAAIIGLL